MLKKITSIVAFITLMLAGVSVIASPASAVGGSSDATLQSLNFTDSRARQSVTSFQGLNNASEYYDVYSTQTTLRIFPTVTDVNATVKITGGNLVNNVPSLNVIGELRKYSLITLNEAINQMVSIVVTAEDGVTTKTYTLNISTGGYIPAPQLISNSLTSLSSAAGDKGVMYIKNFTGCTTVKYNFKYTDSNGDESTKSVSMYTELLATDKNGISKVSVEGRGLDTEFRNANKIANLVVANDAINRYYGYGTYDGCATDGSYSSYSDTVVPNALTFYNAAVTKVSIPATVSQNTAFKAEGPGINDNANLDAYLYDPATDSKMWVKDSAIDNNNVLYTVSGNATWLTNRNVEFVIEQYMNTDDDFDNWPDNVVLFRKAVKFTPQMASQVSVSPAKGSTVGGNKVTISGHGICNPSVNPRLAKITIGGNPVTDMKLTSSCDFFSSSDKENWDGVSKATFLVPAGPAGAASITVDMGYGPTTLSQKYVYGAKPTVTSIAPSTVANTGGSIITLTGANFGLAGTPIVIIDGEKSPYVVRVSSSKVLAMVPATVKTGQVDVDIISSSGGGGLDTLAKLTLAARGTNPTITSVTPANDGVAGGNTIVIVGTGFSTTATGVMFGTIPGKITAATATKLTIEVPTGDAAGAVNLVVGTPTGLVTKANGFTYLADPGVTNVSPSTISSTASANDSKVTITGNGFGTAGKITVGSAAAINYTSTGTSIANIAIPTTKAGSVSISILPTGAKKPFTTSVVVVGPEITYVGPEVRNEVGIADPWEGNGFVPVTPANNGAEELVIEGFGFGATGTVKIGSTVIPVLSYSDTLIKFVSPSAFAKGIYDLVVAPSSGTLVATKVKALEIGAQGINSVIESVTSNSPNSITNGDASNYFYPLTNDSDLYTIKGYGFLGNDAGASIQVRLTPNYAYDAINEAYETWTSAVVVSKTDTEIVFKAPRTIPVYNSVSVQVVTNDTRVTARDAMYYEGPYIETNGYANMEPYSGLCSKTAVDGYTPAVIVLTDDQNGLGTGGVVKVNGTTVTGVVWTAGRITIDFSKTGTFAAIWGAKKIDVLPTSNLIEPSSYEFNCGVTTTVTTKLNGSTNDLVVSSRDAVGASGTVFAATAAIDKPLTGSPFTNSVTNYEFQTQANRDKVGANGSYNSGLPVRAGVYYVRARLDRAEYDRVKYYEVNSANSVKVTITGTDITFTPKLNAGGASLTYKGQLSDGTNGTSNDIGYTASPTPTDAISGVKYMYRNSTCPTRGFTLGLPKNVALAGENTCTGTPGEVTAWEIKIYSYEMNVGGVDKTIHYLPTMASFLLTINKKPATLSSVKAEKTWNNTTAVTLGAITVTGAIEGETITLDNAFARGAAFADAAPGKDKPITLNGPFKLAGIFNTNYNLTNPNMAVLGLIKKANAEIKVVPSVTSLVLGQVATVNLTITNKDTLTKVAPIQAANIGEIVTVSKTAGVCTVVGTVVTPVSAGTCVLNTTQAATVNYNSGISYSDSPELTEVTTIKILATPKDITVVADDLKVAAGSLVDVGTSTSGLLDGDSFDGVEFDYYLNGTKLNAAPSAIGIYKVVPRAGAVQTTSPAAYTNVVKYVAGKLVITPAPPVITKISPSNGPEAGGEKVTINGSGFKTVTSITLGSKTIRKPDFTVNGAGNTITFIVPAGTGGLEIALNAGTAQAESLYTYNAPFKAVEEIKTPETPVAPPVDAPLSLKLALKLAVGSKLSGQNVGISGGGLKAESTYTLIMRSDPLLIYTGTTDLAGNFEENVPLGKSVCLEAGKHSLTLSGISPDGKTTSDTANFTLEEGCVIGAVAKKTGDKEWTLNGFLFAYNSPELSKGGKTSIDGLVSFIKGAKTVTIFGYTETDTKSPLVRALNLILAQKRTEAVRDYLKKKGIVAKFVTVGKGGVTPVSTTNQALNRRVVIKANY